MCHAGVSSYDGGKGYGHGPSRVTELLSYREQFTCCFFSVVVHIYAFTSAKSLVTDHPIKPGRERASNIKAKALFRSDSVGSELNWRNDSKLSRL